MDTARLRLARLRRIALLCAVLLAAVTSLSAFLRHSASGLGCHPWPACYGQGDRAAASGAGAEAVTAVGAARLAHRITATLSLLGTIAWWSSAWPEGRCCAVKQRCRWRC